MTYVITREDKINNPLWASFWWYMLNVTHEAFPCHYSAWKARFHADLAKPYAEWAPSMQTWAATLAKF